MLLLIAEAKASIVQALCKGISALLETGVIDSKVF